MRIGILGGAFDPIHMGHLALAHAAVRELKLDLFFFVPSNQSPLRTPTQASAPSDLRLKMVQESVKGIPHFEVSDIEIKRQGVSYTIDTLKEFRKTYPQPHEIFFIVGGDWGNRLHQWKGIDQIFSLCQFVVAMRPGFEKLDLPKPAKSLQFSPLDISATQLRDMIRSGKSTDQWIPKPALDLIKEHNLYKNL